MIKNELEAVKTQVSIYSNKAIERKIIRASSDPNQQAR